ncbi:zinc finger BED domain-containing protein DAYSLEEPER-like [Chenopodium quinoa]|uniref:zinc finger BED domain-containing protein DAYSLEEPER-like n=1 Tax=Chenopodium quinoa TaxID=63459 RepID=UPI000B76E2ED|nr:zinc finger BED domain-containing protein DAYSLEEPER-like [Chenopodium quinoa]
MYIVEYYFHKIYGDDSQDQIDRIRKVSSELLEEYQAKDKNNELDEQAAMSAFDLFLNERKKNKVGVTTELDYYLDEDVLPRTNDFNVISWWHTNGLKYPTLQSIARDVLAIPVSKLDSGAVFCTVGRVLEQYYNKLDEETVEALMCRRDWLISDIPGGYVSEDEEDSFWLSDEDSDNE